MILFVPNIQSTTSIICVHAGNVSVDKLRQFIPALILIMKANLEEVDMEQLGENIFDDIVDAGSLYVRVCKSSLQL